jgi:hypothetical protein
MTHREDQPTFCVHLQALPDPVAPTIRLRRFLKGALRAYNLRCTRAVQLSTKPDAPGQVSSQSE